MKEDPKLWLYRLFNSTYFDTWLTISYLQRYPSTGIHYYLCTKLRLKSRNELLNYLPHLVQIMLLPRNDQDINKLNSGESLCYSYSIYEFLKELGGFEVYFMVKSLRTMNPYICERLCEEVLEESRIRRRLLKNPIKRGYLCLNNKKHTVNIHDEETESIDVESIEEVKETLDKMKKYESEEGKEHKTSNENSKQLKIGIIKERKIKINITDLCLNDNKFETGKSHNEMFSKKYLKSKLNFGSFPIPSIPNVQRKTLNLQGILIFFTRSIASIFSCNLANDLKIYEDIYYVSNKNKYVNNSLASEDIYKERISRICNTLLFKGSLFRSYLNELKPTITFFEELVNIGKRLKLLPRNVRDKGLSIEIDMLNYNLPANVEFPLLYSKNKQILNLVSAMSYVLDSADNAPYFICMELGNKNVKRKQLDKILEKSYRNNLIHNKKNISIENSNKINNLANRSIVKDSECKDILENKNNVIDDSFDKYFRSNEMEVYKTNIVEEEDRDTDAMSSYAEKTNANPEGGDTNKESRKTYNANFHIEKMDVELKYYNINEDSRNVETKNNYLENMNEELNDVNLKNRKTDNIIDSPENNINKKCNTKNMHKELKDDNLENYAIKYDEVDLSKENKYLFEKDVVIDCNDNNSVKEKVYISKEVNEIMLGRKNKLLINTTDKKEDIKNDCITETNKSDLSGLIICKEKTTIEQSLKQKTVSDIKNKNANLKNSAYLLHQLYNLKHDTNFSVHELNQIKEKILLNFENSVKKSSELEEPILDSNKLKTLSWDEKKEIIESKSKFKHIDGYEVTNAIIKRGKDLRQEVLALQVLEEIKKIFKEEKLSIYLKTYKILLIDNKSAIIETVNNLESVHVIKKKNKSIKEYFIKRFNGENNSLSYKKAISNFLESLVGYSLATYLLQVKDRHNGNILINTKNGRLVHVDFGFILGDHPGFYNVERAPFKLSAEYLEMLEMNHDIFKSLFLEGFIALRKNSDRLCRIIEIMTHPVSGSFSMASNIKNNGIKCVTKYTLSLFRDRLKMEMGDAEVEKYVTSLIDWSMSSMATGLYDSYQYFSNGYMK